MFSLLKWSFNKGILSSVMSIKITNSYVEIFVTFYKSCTDTSLDFLADTCGGAHTQSAGSACVRILASEHEKYPAQNGIRLLNTVVWYSAFLCHWAWILEYNCLAVLI